MKISQNTLNRIIAAAGAIVLVALVLAVILIGKTGKYKVTYIDGDTVIRTEKVDKGGKAERFVPEAEGKQFDCWTLSDGTVYDFSLALYGDLTLYARWKE